MLVRSPDASWISAERIASLSPEDRSKYWRVCPDVVIEILSDSDSWPTLFLKLEMYERSGARFAVAIDPYKRRVESGGELPQGLRLYDDAIIDA